MADPWPDPDHYDKNTINDFIAVMAKCWVDNADALSRLDRDNDWKDILPVIKSKKATVPDVTKHLKLKHTTVLRLANAPAPTKGAKTEGPGGSVVLSLSYTLDSRSPDIFRLKKGQF